MRNPSYLIRSRHAIYYFRYPVPTVQQVGKTGRISISLGTRCPKEALRLAKVLEYHAVMLTQDKDIKRMTYAEVKELLQTHFAEVLERMKARIDQDGPLPPDMVGRFSDLLATAVEAVQDGREELYDTLFEAGDMPEELSIEKSLKVITAGQYTTGSQEHGWFRQDYKYALRGYLEALLSYNGQANQYRFDSAPSSSAIPALHNKPEYMLPHVIEKYLSEIKVTVTANTVDELRRCLAYLPELLGEDFHIAKMDGETARYVKDCLRKTPARRNILPLTRGLPLAQQMDVSDIAVMKPRTINKHLGAFNGLYKWALADKYVTENPFDGMSVTDTKGGKREDLSDAELALIFAELDKGEDGLANDDMKYWSTLLFLYTGARRNEIANLTADDVKQHKKSGIWYLEITDEKKTKRYGKDSKRRVPIHSALLDREFLTYVERVRNMKGDDLRLLYQLTYDKKDGWGRKLTRWFSNGLFPKLGIKRDTNSLHSTRHTFITRMKATDTEYAIIDALVGHEASTTSESIYTHRDERHVPAFKAAIEKLNYF